MILSAASPDRWVGQHHRLIFPDHAPAVGDRPHRRVGSDELVEEVLPALVERMVGDGTPRQAAGTYLAGWYAGFAGYFLAVSLAATGAGYLLEPGSTWWWSHPDGYPDALVPGDRPRVALLPDHPWRDDTGAYPVTTRSEQADIVVAALVETVTPTIDTIQRLTRAGRGGLWHEVADAIGSALVQQPAVPATPATLALLDGLLSSTAGPWRRRPRVDLVPTARGPVWVSHKGGCCLAYTENRGGEPDLDEDHLAFQAAFPRVPGAPNYCVTCRLRPYDESVRMQLWWREREQG